MESKFRSLRIVRKENRVLYSSCHLCKHCSEWPSASELEKASVCTAVLPDHYARLTQHLLKASIVERQKLSDAVFENPSSAYGRSGPDETTYTGPT